MLINQHWKTTVVDLDPLRDLRFFINHRVRYDKVTGNPYLAKNKKKNKKIRPLTTVERLGKTYAECKLQNKQRKERRAQREQMKMV